jgi:hypothetical protein
MKICRWLSHRYQIVAGVNKSFAPSHHGVEGVEPTIGGEVIGKGELKLRFFPTVPNLDNEHFILHFEACP